MKKVKLLGVLAASTMILAGCTGGNNTSTEPTSTDTSGSTTETSSAEWSEADAKSIKDFVHTNLPAFNDLKLLTIGEEDEYIKMLGKAGTDATVEAYGKLLENYKFSSADFVPEDIDDDYDESSVVYYAKSLSTKTTEMCYVTVGLEDGTNKLLVCATYGSCYMEEYAGGDSVGVYTLNSGYTIDDVHKEIAGYILAMNGAKSSDMEEGDAKDAREKAELELFAFPVIAPKDDKYSFTISDYQYGYPFSLGNAYSSKFHAIIELGYYKALQTEQTDYQTALDAANYIITKEGFVDQKETIPYRDYSLNDLEYGKYTVEEYFYPEALSSGSEKSDVYFVAYDYQAPAAA